MEPVLIAAPAEKSFAALSRALQSVLGKGAPVWAPSGAEARRRMDESPWGLVIVNAPLPDEFGAELAHFAVSQTDAGVLLLLKEELEETLAEPALDAGIFVLTKPLAHADFSRAARLGVSLHRRIAALDAENRKLHMRLEDQRLIGRAKCVLIECCGMTEPQAHAYIEKRAMDTRQTKRDVARELIETNTP